MRNGNRSGFVASEKAAIECDVGLGLRMQPTESFPCKNMMAMPHHLLASSSYESSSGGLGGDSGGGPIFCNTSNQVACMSDIYDVVGAGAGAGAGAAVPRTLYPFNIQTAFKSSGGMAASLRVPFTAAQWQELERQTMIYKYMMASIPVPPELLIPINRSVSDVAVSHSNRSLDLRFSNGSDPEPWRCRRTDGKKWRCSRDVAPDQKYCERHTHKGRPRSRKPVEIHTDTTTPTTTTTHPLHLPANTTTKPYQKPPFLNQTVDQISSSFPTLVSAASYDQPRCSDWFTKKGEAVFVGSSNQQWQQMMQSRVGLKRHSTDCYKNVCDCQQHHDEGPLNSYTDLGDGQGLQTQQRLNDRCRLLISPKLASLQGHLNHEQTHATRHFIDAWSTAERDNINEIGNKCSASSNGKLPLSSLTLSMSGGDGTTEENEYAHMGLMESERGNEGVLKPQWMNPLSWMASPPGGPLAEALCLGIAGSANAASNATSPRGCNSSNTSKSSCGDSGQGLNLI